MRLTVFLLLVLAASGVRPVEDNEFAEFEDEEVAVPVTQAPATAASDQPEKQTIFKEDDGEDEFGIEGDEEEEAEKEKPAETGNVQPLTFTDVPAHFRSNWGSYQVEAVVLFLLSIYMLNYLIGRASNQAIAFLWFAAHKETLEEQFAVVGDDGLSDTPSSGQLQRDTDSVFGMWCTGRVGMNGMMVHVKTAKRHDLFARIWGLFSPAYDRVSMTVDVEPGELDQLVLAVGQRKAVTKLHKEMSDLSQFATEKKIGAQQGTPPSFAIFAESTEAAQALLDQPVVNLLKKYEPLVEYMHLSDQFTGPRPPEGEQVTKLPEPSRVITFSFILAHDQRNAEEELIHMVFYIIDKMRRFRLSREAKLKAEKRRQAVQEAFMRITHQARQDAAQARKEEKVRERKQRLLEEEDPEKQRRLEKVELKREAKMKQPKMKQLKIK